MGICWYCTWGWPKQVADIYDAAAEKLEPESDAMMVLHYGPSHIVWSDENFETGHIQWCIDNGGQHDLTKEEYEIALWSLRELLLVPEEIRCCEPEGYKDDDENPRAYPPPAGLEMVPRR